MFSAHSNASLTQRAGSGQGFDAAGIWGPPSQNSGGPSATAIDRYNQLLQQGGGSSSRLSSLDSNGAFQGGLASSGNSNIVVPAWEKMVNAA